MVRRGLGAWLSDKRRIYLRAVKGRRMCRCAGMGMGASTAGEAEEQGCTCVRFQGKPTRW